MNYKQVKLDIPKWVYKEIDKLSRHKVQKYLIDLITKITVRPQKSSIAKLFDLFASKEHLSLEHDKYLYK